MNLPSVDLWLLWTGDCSDDVNRAWLSPQELMRGERYRSPAKRRQFLLSRMLGRQIISCSRDVLPEQIEWPTTGVPHLRSDSRELPLSMSLSHAGEFLALAVSSPDVGLGVDLEVLDSQLRVGPLAGLALTQHERLLLAELPEPDQARWIQQVWTAKEAVLKSLELETPPEISSFDLSERMVHHLLTLGELRGFEAASIVFTPFAANFFPQSPGSGWEIEMSSGTSQSLVGGLAIRFRENREPVPRFERRWRVHCTDSTPELTEVQRGGFPTGIRRLRLRVFAEQSLPGEE